MRGGAGTLPVRLCGIGILPMLHRLEAHATKNCIFMCILRGGVSLLM